MTHNTKGLVNKEGAFSEGGDVSVDDETLTMTS
jgi:hypothetical protein